MALKTAPEDSAEGIIALSKANYLFFFLFFMIWKKLKNV